MEFTSFDDLKNLIGSQAKQSLLANKQLVINKDTELTYYHQVDDRANREIHKEIFNNTLYD